MNWIYVLYSEFSYFMHNVVLSLCIGSLIGSIGFLLYLLASALFGNRLATKTKKMSLLFVFALFVIPFQTFFLKIPTFLQLFGQYIEWTPAMYEKAILEMQKSASHEYISPDLNIPYFYEGMVLFSYIWLCIFIYKTTKMICEYCQASHELQMESSAVTESENTELYHSFREMSHFLRAEKVELYVNSTISTPMLIGFAKPRIILPQSYLYESIENVTPILIHEFTHYKQKDLWIKFLGQMVLHMHWFNPLVKKLLSMIDFLSEVICDEKVVAGLSREKRELYAQSILNAMKHEKMNIGSVAKFGDYRWECQSIKTRLTLILTEQQQSNRWLSAMFLWCFVLFGLYLCFRFGEVAPRIDSVFPYVDTIYPDFYVSFPRWFSLM